MDEIAERVRELIADTGLTNAEFAEKIDVNPSIISHILKGRNRPSLQVVTAIKSKFTNVNTDYLLTGAGSLYGGNTNVKPPDAEASSSVGGGFPMEGVRVAAMPGSFPQKTSTEPAPDEGADKPAEEAPPPAPAAPDQAASADEDRIEQIVLLYRSGRFKIYRP